MKFFNMAAFFNLRASLIAFLIDKTKESVESLKIIRLTTKSSLRLKHLNIGFWLIEDICLFVGALSVIKHRHQVSKLCLKKSNASRKNYRCSLALNEFASSVVVSSEPFLASEK